MHVMCERQLRQLHAFVHLHMYTYVSSSPTVFVFAFDDNAVRPRCHVSPYTQSTVALAWGIFIPLCAGLFIVSLGIESDVYHHCSSSMHIFSTALPPPPPLHTHTSATESRFHKTS